MLNLIKTSVFIKVEMKGHCNLSSQWKRPVCILCWPFSVGLNLCILFSRRLSLGQVCGKECKIVQQFAAGVGSKPKVKTDAFVLSMGWKWGGWVRRKIWGWRRLPFAEEAWSPRTLPLSWTEFKMDLSSKRIDQPRGWPRGVSIVSVILVQEKSPGVGQLQNRYEGEKTSLSVVSEVGSSSVATEQDR